MWECEYGREPVDYRLIWLRFLRKIWILPIGIAAGVILVGAGYYFAKIVARGGRTYQTESVFYIEFALDSQGVEYDFYNYYTWGEVIHTDFFMNEIYSRLNGELSKEEIISCVSASVDSDVRYLYVRCNTRSPELSEKLALILEELVPRFADGRKELEHIEVATAGYPARDSTRLRMGNAMILGGCIGLAASFFGVLAALIADTAFYLPSIVEKRYRLVCLGAEFMSEFASNCNYYLKDGARIAEVFVDEEVREVDLRLQGDAAGTITACANPVTHPEELERIRECDKVVLCLKAGCKNDESFRRLLEQLGRQNIKITAVILTAADEKLISAYYRGKA